MDKKEIKTFKDLNLGAHSISGKQGRMFFENGYGISVISGDLFYCDEERPYEVAVLTGDEDSYELCYTTHITDDVIGYCTEDDVTRIMREIQEL